MADYNLLLRSQYQPSGPSALEAYQSGVQMRNQNQFDRMRQEALQQQSREQSTKFEEWARGQKREEQQRLSEQAFRTLQWATQPGVDTRAVIKQAFPDKAAEFGVDKLSDEQLKQGVAQMLAQFGPMAGQSPAAPAAQWIDEQGPGGSLLQRNSLTGEARSVVGREPTQAKQSDAWATLTPDEVRAAGFSSGSVVQRNTTSGEYRVVNRPDSGNRDFSRADKLRDEYNKASEEFIKIGDAYTRVREAAKDPSAAGDLSLIFAYMKILDPTSVVREQEFANAQNAAGVPDRVRAAWNKVLNGQRLSGPQRDDFIKQAEKLYGGQKNRHSATVKKRYTDMANRWGVNPDDVTSGFETSYDTPQAPPQPEITATGPNGQKLVLRNGQWVSP